MARVLTCEDVVRRIAAECAFVDERGGVGIRLEGASSASAVSLAVVEIRCLNFTAIELTRSSVTCSQQEAAPTTK
jgi:hypothetical protein